MSRLCQGVLGAGQRHIEVAVAKRYHSVVALYYFFNCISYFYLLLFLSLSLLFNNARTASVNIVSNTSKTSKSRNYITKGSTATPHIPCYRRSAVSWKWIFLSFFSRPFQKSLWLGRRMPKRRSEKFILIERVCQRKTIASADWIPNQKLRAHTSHFVVLSCAIAAQASIEIKAENQSFPPLDFLSYFIFSRARDVTYQKDGGTRANSRHKPLSIWRPAQRVDYYSTAALHIYRFRNKTRKIRPPLFYTQSSACSMSRNRARNAH